MQEKFSFNWHGLLLSQRSMLWSSCAEYSWNLAQSQSPHQLHPHILQMSHDGTYHCKTPNSYWCLSSHMRSFGAENKIYTFKIHYYEWKREFEKKTWFICECIAEAELHNHLLFYIFQHASFVKVQRPLHLSGVNYNKYRYITNSDSGVRNEQSGSFVPEEKMRGKPALSLLDGPWGGWAHRKSD